MDVACSSILPIFQKKIVCQSHFYQGYASLLNISFNTKTIEDSFGVVYEFYL